MQIRNILFKLSGREKILDELTRENKRLQALQGFPPGHFYSPVVNSAELEPRAHEIWADQDEVPGVDLHVQEQLALVKAIVQNYNELPYLANKGLHTRYYFDNDFYTQNDGIILYSMIRHARPRRIIEIGSGFSSAIMLDTNEFCLGHSMELCFIDPYPERLHGLMNETDSRRCRVIADQVQSVSLDIYQELQAGDILFVDSSHVVKTGSDLHHILFRVLPALKEGVLIHFHDIFFPFEYPKTWVDAGRNWNENYLLHAFLMHNNSYRIKLFADLLYKKHQAVFWEMPLAYNIQGTSLWIEKRS